MAQNAPTAIDVQDIQFKLHDKFSIFPEGKEFKSLVSLLAVSSAKGLLFAGNPNAKELKVAKLKDVVDSKSNCQDLPVRVIPLPAEPRALACSCDGSLLAVNYLMNNTGILQVFQVESFLTPKINSLYHIPVSPESYVFALQLLWNPVIANNIALVLNDGSISMFTLNSGGQYDKFSLVKEHQIKSGCWSPKGKQIVLGFAEGKLQQFKPNLQPARAIPCPAGIHPGPFDCIAVHWLSTFQFAAVFLQRGGDMCPSLFIINAPKVGNPSYINYFDICYSSPGPRTQQLSFNHISQWNLLLVSSANGIEVGILGTNESGENPTWTQYTLLDEARIEMPLTEGKDETYPLGFAFDTSSSHRVKIGEQTLPVMPMVHVLSTHGHLVSFNFLNLSPNAVDVCSPPPPLTDTSGQFRAARETCNPQGEEPNRKQNQIETVPSTVPQISTGNADMTFTLGANMVTSTPAIKDKTPPMFGSLATSTAKPSVFGLGASSAGPTPASIGNNKSITGSGFGFGAPSAADSISADSSSAASVTSGFGAQTVTPSFGGFGGGATGFAVAKPADKQQTSSVTVSTRQSPADISKPLYTVPPTFKAPSVTQSNKQVAAQQKVNINSGEIDEVVRQMIAIQIDAFEGEIKHISMQSKKLMDNIGKPEEVRPYTTKLNDLQEIIEQANDYEFEQDVQSLRHSMNEAYAMLAECRTKFDMYSNPNLSRLTAVSSADPTNRRQLAKLQSLATTNQTQLNQLNLLIDAQWSQYQDVVRRNTKNHMHIPCLDGVYQRMSKIKDALTRQRTKLNYIKTKLKQTGLNYKPASDLDITTAAVGALTKNQSALESLADSILSMSLSQVVSQTHAKLSEDKLNAIRNFTKHNQQIAIIRPKRPDRVDLKSEVILETKMETERMQKEQARQKQKQLTVQKSATNVSLQKEMQQHSMHPTQISKISSVPQHTIGMKNPQQQSLLAKPTASKPPLISNPPQPATFMTPTSSTSSGLTFGSSSSFVKTSASSTSFAAFGATQGQTFGQSKIGSDHKADNKENIATNTPISFSPKVIGGNSAKPTAVSNKGLLATDEGGAESNQGFASFSPNKPPHVGDSLSKGNTKQEQPTKTFSFGGVASNLSSSAGTPSFSTAPAPSFGDFGSISKSTASSNVSAVSSSTGGGVFSSSMFGSPSTFTALSTTSAVPLNTSTSFSFTGSSKTSTGTVSSSTSSNAPITNPNATKAGITNDAATTAKPFQVPTSSTASLGNFDVGNNLANNGTTNTNGTTKSIAPPNVVIGAKSVTGAKPATSEPPLLSPSSTVPKADAKDSLLGSLNICKPDTKQGGDVAKAGASVFSGFGASTSTASALGPFAFATGSGAGDGCTSFLSSTGSSTPSTGFSFGMGSTTGNNNIFGKSETGALTKPETSVATTSSASPGLTAATTSSSPAPTSIVASAPTSIVASAPCSTAASLFPQSPTSTASGFGSLSIGGTTVSSSTAATSTAATGNIFGGSPGSSIFGQTLAASTAAATATTSIFSGQPLLGSTVSASSAAATSGAGSLFSSNAVTSSTPSSGSIFGGIPKPDPSVFTSSTNTTAPPVTGLFAAAAASTNLPPAAGGGNIFGGNYAPTGFGAPAAATAGGSIFGGSTASSPFAAPATANNASSIFGGTKPADSANVFGSPTQQSAASGGSLFGKTAFGQPGTTSPQSGGSIFGGAATQPSSGGGFGSSGGSIFGGGSATSNQASGGSIFGASAAATSPLFGAPSAATGFGSFSQTSTAPAFGSPSGSFGAPMGGSFSSPTQQSAFAKPVFGGPATFGSPPAFGAQPTFGGAPTFGSPKGFGAFGSTSPTGGVFGANPSNTAAAPAPNGNIFETLGSTNSGLSFGNLAHNTQQPAQQKPAFGGSSFMSYRS